MVTAVVIVCCCCCVAGVRTPARPVVDGHCFAHASRALWCRNLFQHSPPAPAADCVIRSIPWSSRAGEAKLIAQALYR